MTFVTLLEAPHHPYNATVVLQKTPKSPVYDSVFACVCVSWWKLKWVEVLEWECNCVCESVHYTNVIMSLHKPATLSKIGITKTTRHPLFFDSLWHEEFMQTWIFRRAFLVEVSGHKLESSQTRLFVWFSTLIFPFYKMLFMNRLKFSFFADFL